MWKYICISRYSVIHWSSALVSYGVMPHYLGCLWYYQCYRCNAASLLHRKIEWSWYLLFFKSSDCMADIVQLFYYSSSWRFHISINCGESVATVTPWKIFFLLCSAVTVSYRVTADTTLWLYDTHYSVRSALGYQYALPQIRYTVCDDYWHHTLLIYI